MEILTKTEIDKMMADTSSAIWPSQVLKTAHELYEQLEKAKVILAHDMFEMSTRFYHGKRMPEGARYMTLFERRVKTERILEWIKNHE